MVDFSKMFSADFLEFDCEDDIWRNLKNLQTIKQKNKELDIMMIKRLILPLISSQNFVVKIFVFVVLKQQISLYKYCC